MGSVRRQWAVLVPVFILVLLRIPSLFESFWYGDEAIYAAVAQGMANGKMLYAQVWDHKPPFIFLFFYPATFLGWQIGFPLLRLVNILLGVSSVVLMSEILREKVGDLVRFVALAVFSFLLGSTILEGNVVNAEVIFMVFNLAALCLLLYKKHFFFIGFLGYLSLIAKVPGFVEFAFIALLFAIIYLKEEGFGYVFRVAAKIAVGFVAPVTLTGLYFSARGTMPDFIYANFLFNRIYSLHQGNFVSFMDRSVPATYLAAVSLFTVFLFSTFLYLKKKWSGFTCLAVVLLAAEAFASLLSGKNYSHYFLQVLPAVALLVALLLSFKIKKIKMDQIAFGAVTVLLFVPMIVVFRNGGELPIYARPEEYYPWFLADRDRFWWGKADAVKDFSSYIDAHYLEYSPVYIYTDKPWILAVSQREFANKYVTWFHLQYRQEHLAEELQNMKKAELFVLDRNPMLLEPVGALLESDFEKIDSYGDFDIFLKK